MNPEKQKILLVTAGFPFADTERGFISTEFERLRESYDLYILCVGSRESLIHPFPDTIPVERYFHRVSAKSLTGGVKLLWNALRPETLKELALAAKGHGIKQILKRYQQIVFYRANAQEMEKHMDAIIRKEGISMIYTYWCTEATVAAVCLKRKYPGLKVITRFHGHDLFCQRKSTNWQPFRRFIADRIDRLVFACRMGKDYFLETWGEEYAPKASLHYLGCARTERLERTASKTWRLVSCSNLIPLKRVECIVDAIAQLPETVSVRWDHFGDGTERPALEQRAKEAFGGNVTWEFHGRVPNDQMFAWYRKLQPDLFLTTTTTEGGVPVSLQEAFAMGIPAVGTAVGGVPEVVLDGKTGYLLPEGADAAQVCNAIEQFFAQAQDHRKAMSDRAYRLWEELYDARRNAEEFAAEIEGLLRQT